MPSSPAAKAFLERCQVRLVEALEKGGLGSALVQSRVKTNEAAGQKRALRSDNRINDFFGLRVIVDHSGLMDDAERVVKSWGEATGLNLRATDDYFSRPADGGYRALHFDFEVLRPVEAGLTPDLGVEVQVTTAVLAAVARLSHDMLYARCEASHGDVAQGLEKLARDALDLDERLAEAAARRSV
jgi:ppGpp synthetase/RelA/SpoT-type nucleotidyltranferase